MTTTTDELRASTADTLTRALNETVLHDLGLRAETRHLGGGCIATEIRLDPTTEDAGPWVWITDDTTEWPALGVYAHDSDAGTIAPIAHAGTGLDQPHVIENAGHAVRSVVAAYRAGAASALAHAEDAAASTRAELVEDVKAAYRRALIDAAGIVSRLADHRRRFGEWEDLADVDEEDERSELTRTANQATGTALRLAEMLRGWGVSTTLGKAPDTSAHSIEGEVVALVAWLAGHRSA